MNCKEWYGKDGKKERSDGRMKGGTEQEGRGKAKDDEGREDMKGGGTRERNWEKRERLKGGD